MFAHEQQSRETSDAEDSRSLATDSPAYRAAIVSLIEYMEHIAT
jgi:hypothetical protein